MERIFYIIGVVVFSPLWIPAIVVGFAAGTVYVGIMAGYILATE